jgi:threonyl-tRNA synthetase
MRVRGFTQDDGHVFCTPAQIQQECVDFTAKLQQVYRDFGFDEVIYKVATRPENRVGSDEAWDKAEAALMESLRASGCEYVISPGDGAFYGPKIEYSLKDALGRVWQCGTMQVDFNTAERLGGEYVGEDNSRHTPVMLHRAIVGSLERFIGMLVENYAGAMPAWLAPEQVVICSIAESSAAYAQKVGETLKKQGFRASVDLRGEKITYKIREHSLQKVPYILVVGDKEAQAGSVAVRGRGNRELGVMQLDAFSARLQAEVSDKSHELDKLVPGAA